MHIIPAFDQTDFTPIMNTASLIVPFFDHFFIASPALNSHGVALVRSLKTLYPSLSLMVDSQLVDYGKTNTELLIQSGADWCSVMAGAPKHVISSACTQAHAYNKKILLNLIDAPSMGQSSLEAKSLGVDALLMYKPDKAEEQLAFMDLWDMARNNTILPIFILSPATKTTIADISTLQPEGIIISKTITHAPDPAAEAAFFTRQYTKNS